MGAERCPSKCHKWFIMNFYGVENITENKSIHLSWTTLSVVELKGCWKCLPKSKTKLTHILMITSKLFSFSILYSSSMMVQNVQFQKVSFILLTHKQLCCWRNSKTPTHTCWYRSAGRGRGQHRINTRIMLFCIYQIK